MINRYIRTLPFPPTYNFTPEIVRQIKAIPKEDIQYTDAEIEWMERAVIDIERNWNNMIRHAKLAGRGPEIVTERKKQFEIAIALHKKSRVSTVT